MAQSGGDASGWSRRCVRVRFGTPAELQAAYESHLSCGGLFVATEAPHEMREVVDVWIDLAFCKESVVLQGEVVSCVPAGLEQFGGSGGIALQLLEPTEALRKRFQPYLDLPVVAPSPDPGGRREHERKPARVEVEVEHDGSLSFARSQSVSRSGARVAVWGAPFPVGDSLSLTFVHPSSGQRLSVAASVIHHFRDERGACAVGVRFDCPMNREAEVGEFMEDLQANEHARQLAAIKGPVGTVGLDALLQSLGASSSQGILRLHRGYEEGEIGFAAGLLHGAQLGAVRGVKALARMLAWEDGSFDFVAAPPPAPRDGEASSLEGALFEAVRQLDELQRLEASALGPDVWFSVVGDALSTQRDALSELESEVVELAETGASVRQLLDALAAPDADIQAAIQSLVSKRVLSARIGLAVC